MELSCRRCRHSFRVGKDGVEVHVGGGFVEGPARPVPDETNPEFFSKARTQAMSTDVIEERLAAVRARAAKDETVVEEQDSSLASEDLNAVVDGGLPPPDYPTGRIASERTPAWAQETPEPFALPVGDRRPSSGEVLMPRPATAISFPRESLARAADDLLLYFRSQPTRGRLAWGGGAAGILLFLVVVVVLSSGGSGPRLGYLETASSLLVSPLEGDGQVNLGVLSRGERLQVFGSQGEYVLVSDELSRTGWVREEAVATDPPPSTPDHPFAGCQRGPLDSDTDRCQGRAQEQVQRCRASCEGQEYDSDTCMEHCQERFASCMGLCESDGFALTPQPRPDGVMQGKSKARGAGARSGRSKSAPAYSPAKKPRKRGHRSNKRRRRR